jgi:hypothetical protein
LASSSTPRGSAAACAIICARAASDPAYEGAAAPLGDGPPCDSGMWLAPPPPPPPFRRFFALLPPVCSSVSCIVVSSTISMVTVSPSCTPVASPKRRHPWIMYSYFSCAGGGGGGTVMCWEASQHWRATGTSSCWH